MSMRDGFAKLIMRARAGVKGLTPRQQRRWRRGTIVAAIMAGGVFGLDYVVTGGPDWNPIGADAPRFELVSSAAAAEHPLLPVSYALEPAPELPKRVIETAALETYDPNVSANDLLGAPVYARAIAADVEIAALLEALKPQTSMEIEALIQPLVSQGQWWR